MSVLELTDESFKDVVGKAELPTVVDFWAPWCGPCKMQAPIFDAFAKSNTDKLCFAKIDVEKYSEVGVEFEISSIPTIMVFQSGKVVKEVSGLQTASSLKDFLKEYL